MTKPYEIDIPFSGNDGKRCVPACTKMIVDYLRPDMHITKEQAEALSGFTEDQATWAAQHLLSLHEIGIDVGWIQDEDLARFADAPEEFILNQFGGNVEAYERFAAVNNLPLEASRIGQYLAKGLPLEQREATRDDIVSLALGGYVVRLEVNGKTLADQPGDTAHAVVVSGFDDEHIWLENPDGQYGSKPKQIVPWDTLEVAWQNYHTLQYYKNKV